MTEQDTRNISKISELCIENQLIYDNTPHAMACGCIYLYVRLNKLDINKKNISENCKISEVTINKCYKKIESDKDLMNKIRKIET